MSLPLLSRLRAQSNEAVDIIDNKKEKKTHGSNIRETFRSLRNPQFRMLWLGLLFSTAGMQIDIVARAWLAYTISGSALTVGLVGLARGVPQLIFSLLGGVAADRFDKKKLLIVTQSGLGLITLVNAVLVHLGVIEIWHLIVLGMLQGVVFPVSMPTRQAYIPELVTHGDMSNAIAVTSSGMNLNRVLAPVLAGILLAWNPAVAFYTVASLYCGAVLMLFRLPSGKRLRVTGEGAITEVIGGFKYIWRKPILRTLLIMAFVPIMLGLPFQQLLPVFEQDVLHVGPFELGLMYMAAGIGALIGSLLVARLSEYRRKGLLQMILAAGFGIFLLLFATSTRFELSLALLVLVGFCSQGYSTMNAVLLMLNTDPKLYGRVMGIYMMTWSLVPISVLPLGALTDFMGGPMTLASSGALLSLIIIVIALRYPSHWRNDAVDVLQMTKT